jgi:hypothetical protein
MSIKHRPLFDTEAVTKFYSEKDGVPVTYVCTSAPNKEADYAADIFYRETPHPEFGNRYFGLYMNMDNRIWITNCDMIEDLSFSMIEGPNGWEYSQHRHDYRNVGSTAIDGGRAYVRLIGDIHAKVKVMKVKDGKFLESREYKVIGTTEVGGVTIES